MPTDDALRRKAEASALAQESVPAEDLGAMTPEVARQTLNELRVHQIELEMQNEELRRTQVDLEVSRARYFDLYDLAPVGYVTLSKAGLILEANLTAATLLGVYRGVMTNQRLSRYILQEDHTVYHRYHTQVFGARAPQVCELRMVKPDGTAFWVRLDAHVAQEEDGVCRVVLSDISESKQAEREQARLEALNQQLQKSESLGRMAGAIAHHFNNQLQVVTGHLELAVGDLPEGGGVLESLTQALRATHRASEVSTLMLTYLGQTPRRQEPLDLSEVCRRNMHLLRAAMPKNVTLESDLPSPGPVVLANANQMQQVLTNLVTNAWEAAGTGQGAIHVTVRMVAPAEISRFHRFPIDWQTPKDACACLEVADTGCGVAAKDMDDLFDPFFSNKFTGRGMGLPVVLGIVRTHDGAITVKTKPGHGSVFRVYFPLTAEALPLVPDRAADTQGMQASGTVLLVEDEDMVRDVASAMLVRMGFAVLTAKDGVEAVEVFRKHVDDIRCVVCDLTMPRMNGWETLTAMRQLVPGVPFILASGYTEAQVMEGAHPERPQAYLHKPYPIAALKDALAKAMGEFTTKRHSPRKNT